MMQLNTDVIANRNIGIVFHDDLAVCDPHSHTFFELAYIIHGNAIHTLDGNSDAVKAGDYVFIEPGSVHSFSKTKDEDKLTVINCIFTPELILGNSRNKKMTFMDLLSAPLLNIDVNKIIGSPAFYIFHDSNNYISNMLYAMQYEYSNKMTNYFQIMKNLLISMIMSSIRQVSSKEMQNTDPVTMIKDYVSLHYAENNILNQFSTMSYYSPQYLSARFKTDTGETFKSYLQRVRCDVAEQLMNSTNMTVTQISEAVGYKDVKYFQEIFKKHKHVTPKKLKSHFDNIYNRK